MVWEGGKGRKNRKINKRPGTVIWNLRVKNKKKFVSLLKTVKLKCREIRQLNQEFTKLFAIF